MVDGAGVGWGGVSGAGVGGAGVYGGNWTPYNLSLGTTSAWFDPSDLTSLDQSRTGGTPAAVGSPVGIMLDKSQMNGLTAAAFIAGQSELVAPINLQSGWSSSGGTVSFDSATTYTASATSNVFRSYFTTGVYYQITVTLTFTASAVNIYNASNALNQINPVAIVSGTPYTFNFLAAAAQLNIRCTGAGSVTVSSISVKAIPGNHAIAAADSNRPVLRNPSGSLYELEYDGVDDYFALTSAINITTDMTVIRAFKRASAGIKSIGLAASAASVPRETMWYSSNNISVGLGAVAANIALGDTATGSYVTTVTRNTSTEELRRNGTSLGSRTAAAVSGSLDALGRSNSTAFNSGRMAGLLLIPRQLTAAELAQAERYFGAQVGLSL